MKHIRSACLAALIGLSALAPLCGATDTNVETKTAESEMKRTPPRFSFKFPGGKLEDFAKFLASEAATQNGLFNLVVKADGFSQDIPAFEVRNLDGMALHGVLRNLLGRHGWNVQPLGDLGDSNVGVVVVSRERFPEIPETEPHSVADLLKPKGRYELEDLVSAIQLLWKDRSSDPLPVPKLAFHEKTAILLINGQERDRQSAWAVLQKMRESQKTLQVATDKP
jgi:hypothetical protein